MAKAQNKTGRQVLRSKKSPPPKRPRPKPAAKIAVHICDEQSTIAIDGRRLRAAVRRVLAEAGVRAGEVSLAIVTDPAIHEVNRQFLAHDYATDVLSFLLERDGTRLEGEIVASSDTAARSAARYGWRPADELLLYVIHAALHLVGYDDHRASDRTAMRTQERAHLQHFGLEPRY